MHSDSDWLYFFPLVPFLLIIGKAVVIASRQNEKNFYQPRLNQNEMVVKSDVCPDGGNMGPT